MMIFVLSFIIISVYGIVDAAREPHVDINRIHLLPRENSHSGLISSHERRRSVAGHYQVQTNDYDDHRSGYYRPRLPTSLHLPVPSINPKSTEDTPLKVYEPREDPRLFYQSETYLKKNNGQNVNQEVTFNYPGREVNRATDENNRKVMSLRAQDRSHNYIDNGFNFCIKCPHDRTLIARPGSDRVSFQSPRLFACSGLRAPRNVRFEHMYGPKFGSLLEQGSHLVIGRIMYTDRVIHLCKMQIQVITQSCSTPKYLKSHCRDQNCTFTCRDRKSELYGQSSLQCGSDIKWIGELPVCKAKTWCYPPSPPEHGRVSCKGATTGAGPGLIEGSKCRLRCAKGWRWHPRAVSVCRRGAWTNTLACQRTNKFRHGQENIALMGLNKQPIV